MTSAEWQCTKCGATNRKIVSDTTTRAFDECVTCHRKHMIEKDERPVRWRSTAS